MENANKTNIFQKRFKELVGDTATQEEIAGKVNTSRQNVGNWLNGKSKPDIYALAEISKGYGVSTDWLLGLTDIKTNNVTLQDTCKYTGLSEKAIHSILSVNTCTQTTAYGCGITEEYNMIDTLNYLLENEHFYYFLQPLSCVYRYCNPKYIVTSERLKLNELSTDELNVFFAKMEEYCKDNDCEIISKADLAELKLSYAQNSLLAIFQELIDKSFSENK